MCHGRQGFGYRLHRLTRTAEQQGMNDAKLGPASRVRRPDDVSDGEVLAEAVQHGVASTVQPEVEDCAASPSKQVCLLLVQLQWIAVRHPGHTEVCLDHCLTHPGHMPPRQVED